MEPEKLTPTEEARVGAAMALAQGQQEATVPKKDFDELKKQFDASQAMVIELQKGQLDPKSASALVKKLDVEFKQLQAAHEKLGAAHSELLANCEVLKSQIPKPETSAAAGLPPVGSEVTFVNHAGTHEKAKVTGHGNLGAHLDIQGGHVNDKYKRQEVPKGGPGKNLTFF